MKEVFNRQDILRPRITKRASVLQAAFNVGKGKKHSDGQPASGQKDWADGLRKELLLTTWGLK